jgi:hypothetical protein
MEAAAALRLETIASEANEKVEEEEGENLIRNAFPIVISFSLNCTSRRNALKIFVRFIVGGELHGGDGDGSRRVRLSIRESSAFCFEWG